MMKKILAFLLISFLFTGCEIPSMLDLELNNETEIYGGHGDVCENAYIKVDCMEGLTCREITTKPYVTKVCLNPNEPIKEDLVYKNPYDNNETYILTEDKLIINSTNVE